ncbi:MAG: hypothetical protein K0S74_1723 [Chlamydiales bacterium]|jgi:putative DNA primase/helicase|nr:hypothetical protein [Chlamydiales bacterium]
MNNSEFPFDETGFSEDEKGLGENQNGLLADRNQIEVFLQTLFCNARKGVISLRGFEKSRRCIFKSESYLLDEPELLPAIERLANTAASIPESVFCSPIATFQDSESADMNNLANGLAICVDIDNANPYKGRDLLESILGPASLIISSGGVWIDKSSGETLPKLHLYWRLSKPTETIEEHEKLREIRKLAASLINADSSAASPVHPMRWPGSWHTKSKPVMCTILEVRADSEISLELAEFKLKEMSLGQNGYQNEKSLSVPFDEQAYYEYPMSSSYGKAVIKDELFDLSIASEGQRNNILNKAAFSLGQLIAGGQLEQIEVEAALENTALSIGLGREEIKRTIKSGMTKGKQHPRRPPCNIENQVTKKAYLQVACTEPKSALPNNISAVDSWIDPQPLIVQLDRQPYPVDALPMIIQSAVREVYEFVKAPLPLVACSALSALSLAAQAHINVKRANRLIGPVSLFFLCIGISGERKSSCDSYFTKAINQYDIKRAEIAKPILKEYEAAKLTWEAKRSGLLEAIKKAEKESEDTLIWETKLLELEKDEPICPRVPKLKLGDETSENLAWRLAHKWPSGGIISSEAGIIFGAHSMGKDSMMRNLSLMNILWDGGDFNVGRRTSESFTLHGARLSVGLLIQEDTLRTFLSKADGLPRGTGFLARFLLAWPESTIGSRIYTEAPEQWNALDAFNSRIEEILNIPLPIQEDGSLKPKELGFSLEAKDA